VSLVRTLTYAEARARVLEAVRPLPAVSVPFTDAVGRALHQAVLAPHALPPFRNSAMDGYAVRAADLDQASVSAPVTLTVIEVLPAGRPSERSLTAGQAARIMTGAMLPAGSDTVVPFEDSERSGTGPGERCIVRRPSPLAEHVRDAGADVREGMIVFEPGRELSPHDLALIAALGHANLDVSPVPRVAVLSTGDELLDVGQPLRPGAIHDSNRPMLAQLVTAAGCCVHIQQRLQDDTGHVAHAIRQALETCDIVLTIGGVSAGDHDPVKGAVTTLPDVELWRVAMRPGRPQAFGTPLGRLFFGLPGNPASVACVFEALVRPAIRALLGHAQLDRPRVPVHVAAPVESRAGRTDFVRATLEWREGELWATPAGAQLSGHLRPQSQAHALLVVPEAAERLAVSERAEALVLRMPER
jgi:molybdopterin molybdotransferase